MSQRLRITDLPDVFGRDGGNEDENDEDEDLEDHDEDEDLDEDEEEETVESLKAKLEKAEADRARADRRMRRADRAKSKADSELNKLKTGTAKDLADAQERIAELEAQLAAKSGTDIKSIIREEFRDDTSVAWHNPKLAFELLDLDEVDVDDKGRVDKESLAEAIKDLVKAHPYLVKPKGKAGDEEDEDEEEAEKPKPKSGTHTVRSRQSNQKKRDAELVSKFNMSGRI